MFTLSAAQVEMRSVSLFASARHRPTNTLLSSYSGGEPGRPPCERCIREQHECILGGSRRGGRRVKRSHSDISSAQGASPLGIDSIARPQPFPTPRSDYQSTPTHAQQLPSWIDRESRVLPPLPQEPPVHSSTPAEITVASTDLQNPADALEFLAHVAERDGSNQLPPIRSHGLSAAASAGETRRSSDQGVGGSMIHYPPLTRGQLSLETIEVLLARYS